MRGRLEGIKFNWIFVSIFIVFWIGSAHIATYGQKLPDSFILRIEQKCAEGGGDMESMMAYFEYLLEHQININKASQSQLENFGLLSPFQIVSLLEYRKEYGEILSEGELSLVDGFNDNVVKEILPFITFYKSKNIASSKRDYISNELIFRSKHRLHEEYKYGVPYYFLVKYKFGYGDKIKLGITMENDSGEPFYPDFSSAHIAFSDIRISKSILIKNLVLGDFSVRFGQGLVLWNSFSLSSHGAPSAIYRKESAIIPYSSTDESNYFRGVGLTTEIGRSWKFSLFASRRCRDAKIEGDYYTSLPSGGLHNTISTIATRKKLVEYLVGGNCSYRMEGAKIGATVAVYRFDKKNGIEVRDYNQFHQFEGWWGNVSLDAVFFFGGKYRLFGEFALDRGGGVALLAGGVYSPSSAFELSILPRYYSKRYIGLHSGGYSSSSRISNEYGVVLNGLWNPSRSLSISMVGDFIYYPWKRFGIDSQSFVIKASGQVEYSINSISSIYGRLSYYYRDYENINKGGLRVHYTTNLSELFTISARGEVNCSKSVENKFTIGALCYLDFNFINKNNKFGASIRTSAFHIDNWDDRIYTYEKDLPKSFAVPAMYGRGLSVYSNFKYKPCHWMGLYFKVSYIKLFDRVKNILNFKLEFNLTF